MKAKRYTEDQVIGFLKAHEAGTSVYDLRTRSPWLRSAVPLREAYFSKVKQWAYKTFANTSALYVRHAPWYFGKVRAFKWFHRFYGWEKRVVQARIFNGRTMDVVLPDIVSSVIYTTGWWEHAITRYVLDTLSPGDIFVDVGANLGYYSIVANELRAKVYAIEASPEIFSILKRNATGVSCINAAACEQKGALDVYAGDESNLSKTTIVKSVASRRQMRKAATIMADTLDALVGEDLYNARIIKIDVEGAEPAVIKPLVIDRFHDHTEWLLEISPLAFDPHLVLDPFRESGYRAYVMPNEYRDSFYFQPKKRHQIHELKTTPETPTDVLLSKREIV